MDTPNVNYTSQNLTTQVTLPVAGISFVRGVAVRGPFDQPDTIIYNFKQFVDLYGPLMEDDDVLMVQRLLDKGCPIRFSRIGHYTTIGDRSTLSAEKAEVDAPYAMVVGEDSYPLFELNMKYAGADYNNVIVAITDASNGNPNYFNLSVVHVNQSSLNREYTNLTIPGKPTVGESNYLNRVITDNPLLNVVYKDLSAIEEDAPLRPTNGTFAYEGGTDGGAITDTDRIGSSSSNTGFHSFDEYEDSYQLILLDASTAVGIAGAAYADSRKDLQYWHFLKNSNADEAAYIAERAALGFNTKYAAIFAGGLTVLDAFSNQQVDIAAITDIAALASLAETGSGINFSFAGNTRGTITGALGVVNNYGTSAKKGALNQLSNRQINMIVNKDGRIKLMSNFSSQLEENSESFNQIVRLVMFIKKALRPTLEKYLEEPCDVTSWLRLYYEVKPFLSKLVTQRALKNWEWNGDQFARSASDYAVNNAADVAVGKYKVELILAPIVGIQQITVNITLTDGTLTLEDVQSLT